MADSLWPGLDYRVRFWSSLKASLNELRASESPEELGNPPAITHPDPSTSMNRDASQEERVSTNSFVANALAASSGGVKTEPDNVLPADMVLDPQLVLSDGTCSAPSDPPVDSAAAVDQVLPSTSRNPSSLVNDTVNEVLPSPQPSYSSLKESILPQKLDDGELPTRIPSKDWPWQVERKSTRSGGFVTYCDQCSNCYRAQNQAMAKSSLLRHKEQVHGLERPYKCPNRQRGCDYSARRQAPVDRHVKSCGY